MHARRYHVLKTIREFLALPVEALPSAMWIDDEDGEDVEDVWDALRDYARPSRSQRMAHGGERVRLRADRDGWRDDKVTMLVND